MVSNSPGCPTFAENKATPGFLPPHADWLQPGEQAALRTEARAHASSGRAAPHPRTPTKHVHVLDRTAPVKEDTIHWCLSASVLN